MAGDWIPMRTDLHEDPAVIGICTRTGLEDDAVVGKLLKIWGWAQSQTTTGIVPNVTAEWINRKVNREGFAEAMSAEGWLAIRTGAINIPKFERWLSHGAKARLGEAIRKRSQRRKKEMSGHLSGHLSGQKSGNVRTTVQDSRDKDPPTPQTEFGVTPAELARAWSFYCTRKRNRAPQDKAEDMTDSFRSLIGQGLTGQFVLSEIEKPEGQPPQGRDRGEYFWQFKDRILKCWEKISGKEKEREKSRKRKEETRKKLEDLENP